MRALLRALRGSKTRDVKGGTKRSHEMSQVAKHAKVSMIFKGFCNWAGRSLGALTRAEPMRALCALCARGYARATRAGNELEWKWAGV